MDLTLLWLQLAAAAIIILLSSNFLAKAADVIAFKTGLGRTFIGVVLLATATSLPELATGVSSVTFVNEPDLAAGDAFGSNVFNLLIIALLDIFWRNEPILSAVGRTSITVGVLGLGIMTLAAAGIIIHTLTPATGMWFISPVSILMMSAFLVSMYIIYRSERGQNNDEGHSVDYADISGTLATIQYALAAGVIVGAAIWLAQTGDRLSDEMGWEASFIGTQFLAFSTSLPELAASFAAIRLNAPELAISNVLGSNLFNMGFILSLDDLAFGNGALWAAISQIHVLTALVGILMTAVVLLALVNPMRRRPGKYWTIEAATLIILYMSASVLVFNLA